MSEYGKYPADEKLCGDCGGECCYDGGFVYDASQFSEQELLTSSTLRQAVKARGAKISKTRIDVSRDIVEDFYYVELPAVYSDRVGRFVCRYLTDEGCKYPNRKPAICENFKACSGGYGLEEDSCRADDKEKIYRSWTSTPKLRRVIIQAYNEEQDATARYIDNTLRDGGTHSMFVEDPDVAIQLFFGYLQDYMK